MARDLLTAALCCAALCLPETALAAGYEPDLPARTPAAEPGSPAAARSGLSLRQLRHRAAAAMADDGSAGGAWIYDTEARGDRTLFADDASRELIPASNQKLFTTAAFLDELGAEGRLETRVYTSGGLAGPEDSVLRGDLVIVGDGDPAFGTAKFARANDQPVTQLARLARSVAQTGIEEVTGSVLADDTIFDRERRAGPDLSPLSGLSFNNGYAGGGYASAPELVAAKELKAALRHRGIEVTGRVGHADLPQSTLEQEPLASIASPAAAKLIEETNVPSNNFFAEMLLKRLGASSGRTGTRHRGNNKVEAFTEQLGSDVQSVDGSGLSRKNRASPKQIGTLLAEMLEHPDAAAFRDSLPLAGREGTVADRMEGTAASGNCATKTGTLSDVSALSGYCEANGHTIVFSLLMNSADIDAARRAQDRIAAAIARYAP